MNVDSPPFDYEKPGKVELDSEPDLADFAYFLYPELRDLPLFSFL